MKLSTQVDSQTLFKKIVQIAQFPDDTREDMEKKFEAAVFVQTLKTLLDLLPSEQRQKLETTMHFQPEFFLNRSLAILQTFASMEQIIQIFEKSSEETFLEFFDTFLKACSDEQKKKIDAYLDLIQN